MDTPDTATLDAIDFVPETLMNAVIFGAGGEKIGTVSHVHGLGPASVVIVDVSGFLGLGERSVMLNAKDLTFVREADGRVHATTTITKDQVRALPEHSR